MIFVPKEFNLGGVYFPPMLIAVFWAVVCSWLTAFLFNKYRLSRFFAQPSLILLALTVIYTIIIGIFIIPF